MIETLQHDPRTKQNIKEMLYLFLYGKVQKQFEQQLAQIIRQNTLMNKYTHDSFLYRGEYYSNEKSPPPRKMNRLDASLIGAMDAYIQETRKLNQQEIPKVVGYITQVLNSSNDLQDYLKIFPAVLHPPLEKLIKTCPFRNQTLTEAQVQQIQASTDTVVTLVKQRMITNMII